MAVMDGTYVPGKVLTSMTHAVIADTAGIVLEAWELGDEYARFGDPFGEVLIWIWSVDPDRAVEVFTAVLHRVRHGHPDGTKEITLDLALRGLRMDLPSPWTDAHRDLFERLQRDVPSLSVGDVNSTK